MLVVRGKGRSPVDFYVTTEVGAVSEHWCGMQVRWTGKGRTGMAVVHDPGTLRGYLLIAFSVVVAVITFVISGNLVGRSLPQLLLCSS